MKKLFSSLMFVALAAMTFTACEDVPEPYDKPGTGSNAIGGGTEIEGGEGDGSLANPFNSVAALNYGKNLASGQSSEGYMYIKGKVSSVKEEFSTDFGNGTFYISDDGTATNQFYAYRVLYLGNKKFAASDDQVKVGDEVIVCGIITNYNGTIETAQSKGFLYSLNGVNRGGEPGKDDSNPGEAKGSGTLADPYNAQAAINYAKSLAADTESETEIYIKGKVSTIKNNYVADDYGNATFYISDDGTTTNEFYCFRTLYLGNAKYTSGALLNVGDEVIICGKVVNYKGNTPETVSNKSYLYSLNGSTEPGDTPDPGPGPSTETNVTKSIDGTTMTLTYNDATESANTISVDLGAQGWTNAQEVTELTLSDGTKITFGKGEGSTVPKYYDATKGMRLYAKNVMTIEGVSAIAKVVIVCDDYNGACVGNAALYAQVAGNTMTIVNEHSSTSGGTQFRPKTMVITYAQ